MKAAVVREFGEPLVIEERPDPEPGPGQVRVRVGRRKDARRFVRRRRGASAERPVWFFGSGPLDPTASGTSRRYRASGGSWPDWTCARTSRPAVASPKAPRAGSPA
ncbi:hypothetical protein [Streptomyces sp. NPDC093991]|uniref:hypothetical protein n=1 Tax=Streptomyces sp. NPDC093991 TaxID=3155078 RepID=UPI00343A6E0C